ncbi:unnamed protein product [Meganyctiphanes norvegica]|uniref:Uncharacterized protein n=1 Tax=Meganyctiphanes norvegica TaxID=48144 RepID=A0AAV2Q5J5_MEGNR
MQAQPAVRKAWNNTTTNYAKGKQLPTVGVLFVWFEMYSSWLWRTVHAIPYPELVVSMVYQVDDRAERALNYTVNQAEWWWNSNSIHIERIRESLAIRQQQVVELLSNIMGRYMEFLFWYIRTNIMIIKWSMEFVVAPVDVSNKTWTQLKKSLESYKINGIRSNNNGIHEQHNHQGYQHQQQFVDTDDEVEVRRTNTVAKGGSLRRLFQKSDSKGSIVNGDVNGYPSGDEQRPLSPTSNSRTGSLKRFPRIFSSKNNSGNQSGDDGSAYEDSPASSAPGSPEPQQKLNRSSSFFGKKSSKTSENPKSPTGNVMEGSRRTFSMKGLRSRK